MMQLSDHKQIRLTWNVYLTDKLRARKALKALKIPFKDAFKKFADDLQQLADDSTRQD